MKKLLPVFVVALLVSSCSEKTSATTSTEPKSRRQYLSLLEYLQTTPGVQITQIQGQPVVTVRGLQSLGAGQEPLYIVNGSQIGNSYQQAADMVDPNDIRSVQVLKDIESTSMYGLRGSNGVIVIRTGKKNQ